MLQTKRFGLHTHSRVRCRTHPWRQRKCTCRARFVGVHALMRTVDAKEQNGRALLSHGGLSHRQPLNINLSLVVYVSHAEMSSLVLANKTCSNSLVCAHYYFVAAYARENEQIVASILIDSLLFFPTRLLLF